jgi:hypothetical protein
VVVSVVTSALKAAAAWWLKVPPEEMRRVRGCFAGGQPPREVPPVMGANMCLGLEELVQQ